MLGKSLSRFSNAVVDPTTAIVFARASQAILLLSLSVECLLAKWAPKSVTYYNSPNRFARTKIMLTDDVPHLLRPLGVRSRIVSSLSQMD
jgi:hypothetical protein